LAAGTGGNTTPHIEAARRIETEPQLTGSAERLAESLWLTGSAVRVTRLADKAAVLAVRLGPVAWEIKADLEIVEGSVTAVDWVIAVVPVTAAGLVIAAA
jgi:hypothetical protein